LTTDDDSGDYANALIANYRLPRTGEYGIVVRGFYEGAVGSYGLSLFSDTVPRTAPPVDDVGTLPYNELWYGQLNRQACEEWTFYGYAGDTVQVDMWSADFDTYLYLYDPYNSEMAHDDDSGGGTDSLLVSRLYEDGLYTVYACAFGERATTGAYNVSLTSVGGTAPSTPSGGERDVRQATLSPNTYDYWRFDAMLGEVVTIEMWSDDFDAYLELYDPNGNLLAEDDDSGGDYNAMIADLIIPDTGQYEIHMRSYTTDGGDYRVALSFDPNFSGETLPPYTASGDFSIAYGERVTDALTGRGGHRWAFYGQAGDTVYIRLASRDFDTVVELHDPSLTLLATNDDSSGSTNSYLSYTLPVTGEYGIVVHGYSSGASGQYSLSLSK
jgi:hypothetical protein